MKDVIIIGAGAVAAELTSYIMDNNRIVDERFRYNIIGYVDFKIVGNKFWKEYNFKKPFLGNIEEFKPVGEVCFIIGIGNIKFKRELIKLIKRKGLNIVNFIHYSSIIDEDIKLGIGNIIYPFCIIGKHSIIGDYNHITAYSFISHDCVVGENNFFSTTGLSGYVRIGNDNFFGVRATVIPKISIGSRNVIQAGMVVEKNIKNDSTLFFRYKEKILAIPK